MYLTTTHPDLMVVVSLISHFMACPTQQHGVFYKRRGVSELIGFTDSEYVGDIEDRKNTSGYVFMMSEGGLGHLESNL